jgi:hypothetical protein
MKFILNWYSLLNQGTDEAVQTLKAMIEDGSHLPPELVKHFDARREERRALVKAARRPLLPGTKAPTSEYALELETEFLRVEQFIVERIQKLYLAAKDYKTILKKQHEGQSQEEVQEQRRKKKEIIEKMRVVLAELVKSDEVKHASPLILLKNARILYVIRNVSDVQPMELNMKMENEKNQQQVMECILMTNDRS